MPGLTVAAELSVGVQLLIMLGLVAVLVAVAIRDRRRDCRARIDQLLEPFTLADQHGAAIFRSYGDHHLAGVADQRTIKSGHPDHAPAAMVSFADYLAEERGRPKEAEHLYRRAIATEHHKYAPLATTKLAELLGGGQESAKPT